MNIEKNYTPLSGYLMLAVVLVLSVTGIYGWSATLNPLFFSDDWPRTIDDARVLFIESQRFSRPGFVWRL